jgi:hypothetical protein
MSRRRIFKFFYYTHIPLVLLAMVLTGTISSVLYGDLNFKVILLVGLSTYLTYSLDNLFDWRKDQSHYLSVQSIIQTYHKITYLLIPAAALGIFILVNQSSNELRIGILLLGAAAAMSTTRFSIYRGNTKPDSSKLLGFFLNRLFISFIWTTVCVFLPIWYENLPIKPITWHTFLYMYSLILSYAVIWKLEKSDFLLQKTVFSSKVSSLLMLLPMLALFLVVYDILIGLAPLHNLINLFPPIACMAGLLNIIQNPFNLQKKISRMTLILILLCSFSATLHLILA